VEHEFKRLTDMKNSGKVATNLKEWIGQRVAILNQLRISSPAATSTSEL
jgi:hypothetical protein